jgi:hypothetical protein
MRQSSVGQAGLGVLIRTKAGRTSQHVFHSFLSGHLEWLANKTADEAINQHSVAISDSLSDALLGIGTGIVKASISPTANGLYKVAMSESSRFREAAESYWKFGPNRAIEQVRKQLELAKRRGEIHIEDCALADRQFVAMLRGDLQLKVLFGVSPLSRRT